MISAERGKPSESRPTNWVVCASSAPATPAIPALSVKTAVSRRSTGAPMAGIRLPPSRMPRRLKPNGELTTRRSTHEEHERHDQRVDVRRPAVETKGEQAEKLPHRHAGEAVDATGDERRLVRGLEQHQSDAERHHQPCEILPPDDEEADGESRQRRHGRGGDEARQRLAPAVHGKQAGRIGAETEEGRVAQRDDAGVAEDEVERNREQSGDQDLAAEHQMTGQRKVRGDRDQPERELDRPPAVVRERVRGVRPAHARRPYSPAGNRISTTTMIA